MNYNPYAAPQAAPLQAQGTAPVGAPQPWEVGEVLSRAWEIYKLHWGVLTGALAVFALCTVVPFGVLGGILERRLATCRPKFTSLDHLVFGPVLGWEGQRRIEAA